LITPFGKKKIDVGKKTDRADRRKKGTNAQISFGDPSGLGKCSDIRKRGRERGKKRRTSIEK